MTASISRTIAEQEIAQISSKFLASYSPAGSIGRISHSSTRIKHGILIVRKLTVVYDACVLYISCTITRFKDKVKLH